MLREEVNILVVLLKNRLQKSKAKAVHSCDTNSHNCTTYLIHCRDKASCMHEGLYYY